MAKQEMSLDVEGLSFRKVGYVMYDVASEMF